MPKMIQLSFGEYGVTIASPFISDKLLALLVRTPMFVREYIKGPDGEYANVFLRQPVIVRYCEPKEPVFDGTADEYRNQPPKPLTHADLVAQLSAANDHITVLEDTVRSLNQLLAQQTSPDEAMVETAE